MPALIEGEYVKTIGQGGRDKIPPVGMRGAAVDEEDRRSTCAAIIRAAQDQTVRRVELMRHDHGRY
jgi:hypothetical protein